MSAVAAEYVPVPAALSILPEDATCSAKWIDKAAEVAAKLEPPVYVLIVIAYNFEPDALQSPNRNGELQIHCLRANRDLMIEGLEVSDADHAFVEISEPVILITREKDQLIAEVLGYDTFNPRTGNLTPGGIDDIQCWMIDTNYDLELFIARRFHFPGKGGDKQIKRFQTAMKRRINNAQWDAMLSLKSTPFPRPKTCHIAVRIITKTGVEMMKVIDVRELEQ